MCAWAASNRWYLPSGTTLRGATLHLALFNPFPDPTSVDISFATDEGPISPWALTGMAVPARSLRVVTVENPSRRAEVATTITTRTGRIVVERLQIYDGTGDSVAGSGKRGLHRGSSWSGLHSGLGYCIDAVVLPRRSLRPGRRTNWRCSTPVPSVPNWS